MQYHKITTTSPFHFELGAVLPSLDIVFHTSEHERRKDEKVIWICHALTANSDAQQWWPEMVGPGKFIDTDKYFVVCVNVPGSAYGTSSPRSINPATGKPFFFDFPLVTIRDMANAFTLVRKHLGIESIDLLIGSSIGGFQALEWAVSEADIFRRAVFIATAPRISPWLSAMAETQRMALEADQTFRECKDLLSGSKGLECARAQALLSYRCFEGYGISQQEDDPDCFISGKAPSYQRYQGLKLVRRGFDAYSYRSMCNSLDSHNLGRGRGGVEKALGSIKAKSIVIVIDTDVIFPPQESSVWAPMIPGAKFYTITSKYGHDGFLLETEQLQNLMSGLFDF